MDAGLSDEELLLRAKEERRAIVNKYDQGREKGNEIPEYEDPNNANQGYFTDRYGFIHDKPLPETRTKDEEKKFKIEVIRFDKWSKMIAEWSKYDGTEKLEKRIFKGIPNRFRGIIWSRLLRLDTVKQQQRGKYEEMKRLGREWSPDVRQIDLDVNRTYRDHDIFRLRYNTKQVELFHVLVAYSIYNQEVGYCQGMSQIAALLLMYLNEEDAFWALSALMSDLKYAMHGFFIHGFPKLIRYQVHHDKILEKFLPKLKKHLDRNCIDSSLYTLKWFFQCYLDRVPFSITLRLWDILFLEGERLLIAMAYTILKLHHRTIARLDMDQILDFLQKRLEKNFGYDEDETIKHLEKNMDQLKKVKLDYPGPPPDNELPQKPFGMFVVPTIAKEMGKRAEPSEEEKRITKMLMDRQESIQLNGSHLSVDHGSRYSLDHSIDEVSSLGGVGGSRPSLANTSLTSAADLSTLSSSRRCDADDESLQSGRSLASPDARSIQSVKSPRSPLPSRCRTYDTPPPSDRHEPMSNGDADEEEQEHNGMEDTPPASPSTPRPDRLSVSQTTLLDANNPSEPPTPKASETPDTVRIFVPYPGIYSGESPNNGDAHDITLTATPVTSVPFADDPHRIKIRVDREVPQGFNSDLSQVPSPNAWSRPITLDSPEYGEGLM